MSAETTDEELFRRFRGGDREAFSALVGRFHVPIRSFLFRRVGRPHRAEELAQETFLRAFARGATFEEGRPFKPWLYAIALNVARAEFRDRRPTPLRLDTGAEPAPGAVGGDLLPDPAPGPDAQAAEDDLRGAVRDAVAGLPEAQQEVVILSQYQGLSYPEIAEVTGRPLGTIKSLMHYAVKTLRGRLEPLRRKLEDT
jgi:RNA polymerase sigma-70 factor (ECF subfamily)